MRALQVKYQKLRMAIEAMTPKQLGRGECPEQRSYFWCETGEFHGLDPYFSRLDVHPSWEGGSFFSFRTHPSGHKLDRSWRKRFQRRMTKLSEFHPFSWWCNMQKHIEALVECIERYWKCEDFGVGQNWGYSSGARNELLRTQNCMRTLAVVHPEWIPCNMVRQFTTVGFFPWWIPHGFHPWFSRQIL